jgi:hypothetical protein
MLGEQVLEALVFVEQGVFGGSDGGEVFFEAEDFLLEGFDVEFFALAVGSGFVRKRISMTSIEIGSTSGLVC